MVRDEYEMVNARLGKTVGLEAVAIQAAVATTAAFGTQQSANKAFKNFERLVNSLMGD